MAGPNKLGAFFRAASLGAVASVIILSSINGMLMNTGYGNAAEFTGGAILGIAAVGIFTAIVAGALYFLNFLPAAAIAAIGGALLALAYLRANGPASLLRTLLDPAGWELPRSPPDSLSVPALAAVVLAVACTCGLFAIGRAGSYAQLGKTLRRWLAASTVLLAVIGLAVIYDLARDGSDPFPASYRMTGDGALATDVPDPSQPGPYRLQRLSYGAGENLRRKEFGADRDIESRTVDASALLADWKDLKQRMRERYWGFGLSDAPLNGLLWAPLGDGPFPLVLIVHGNHGMEDYSDTGYAYLGELLASRGFIAVSIDENFINGSWSGDFMGKEMPLRAWLLLEHLKLWREWNANPRHRFFGRVDLDNIALIGHSRGGEAVSIADAYNALHHHPDDATVTFDYGFNIRSLVAIAQIDQRYHRRVELENVNFFTIHGSYDSDEPAYHGMRQFNRIRFNDEQYWIKAGVYLHGANHGQFNTGWGRSDYSPPGAWLLNLAPIMPAEDQRQAAKTYIAAFLEATLHEDRRYLDFLRDPRAGSDWLPDRPYVQQFTDSTFRVIAGFEEDIDVNTASADQATITANALALWREEELLHRDERKQGTNVVVLGWNADSDGEASYSIGHLGGGTTPLFAANRSLSLSVSGSTAKPPEIEGEEHVEEDADEPRSPAFRVEIVDSAGNVASALSSDYVTLAPPMRVRYMKNSALNDARYHAEWEPILQHFELPLADLAASNPSFEIDNADVIRFRFDQAPEGVIILDDIGVLDTSPPSDNLEPEK